MAGLRLIVGLGNPGSEHARTRHNAGFHFVEALAEKAGARWNVDSKLFGETAKVEIAGQTVWLLKPATFMNESGRAAGEALRFYKLEPDALTVFHDELDLAPFKVKVRVGGGLAGHNGLKSINQHVGPDFRRVRIGIGHPGTKERVHGHVLGNYAKAEMDPLTDMLAGIAAEAKWLAAGDDARFMSDLALRI